MIDLHCHVLPGIDDGPPDLAGAVAMLRAYAADGVTTVAATPHLREDFPAVRPRELAARCAQLDAAGLADGLAVRVVPGGEVALGWALRASDDDLAAVSLGAAGRDLLVETPANPLGPGIAESLEVIARRGYRITLAHPEVSRYFQREPERLLALTERGVLLQITAGALFRSPRTSASAALAHRLIREGRAAAVAADAHSPGPWRPPGLARAAAAAARIATPAQAEWLTLHAPEAILAGQPLPPLPAAAPAARARRRRLRRQAA